MLVVMQSHATEEQVREVCKRIESLGLKAHPIPGSIRTAIGITGNKGAVDLGVLESMPGVGECIPVSKPYKLVSRDAKEEDSIFRIPTPSGDVIVGGQHVALIAGPCAVETEEQCLAIAERVKKSGARLFRGGAYKPRTSPYSFQGLGENGLKILSKVRAKYGFGIVTEAIDNESLDLVEEYADVIQIGARNMQNFSLLKRAGRAKSRFFSSAACPPRSMNFSWPLNISSPRATTTSCFANAAFEPSPIFRGTPWTWPSSPRSKSAATCPSLLTPATVPASATRFCHFPALRWPSALTACSSKSITSQTR